MADKTVYIGGAPEARQKIDWTRLEAQTTPAASAVPSDSNVRPVELRRP